MTYNSKYINFSTRFLKNFLLYFSVLIVVLILIALKGKLNLNISMIAIFIWGSLCAVYSYYFTKSVISKIEITSEEFIIEGYDFNNYWTRKFDFSEIDMRIKPKLVGRGNIEFVFKIDSELENFTLNELYNWNYMTMVNMFKEYKEKKGEKISFDESDFLKKMEKKSEYQNAL